MERKKESEKRILIAHEGIVLGTGAIGLMPMDG
jgi:hypothetical protein